MSRVTNIVLLTGCAEEDEVCVVLLNKWLFDADEARNQQLNNVSQHAGGVKVLEANCWIGAFNHFYKTSEMIEHIKTLPWLYREEVVVCILEEQTEAWSITTLKELP